ncbi:hypothetical protein GE09DRAFT_756332 [Coniochaeta sp. 2T2.1]|nr:hypothetical protein GE09DRAFT_756332 [Coniochaeta sp. 2T2.1]
MTSNMDNSSLPQQQPETTQAAAARRARISYACEACRAAKVKCQPSVQPGICKRCSDSKRECIFKTGPRTRRPRKKIQTKSSSTPSTPRPAPPPPSGPSKTFTIDIPMQDEFEDLAANLEDLRLSHEMHVADLLPEDDDYASYSEYTDDDESGDGEGASSSSQHRTGGSVAGASSASHASSLPLGASALSTPPSSVSYGKSAQGRRKGALASLGLRPQFNLDSAEKLLVEFETRMLLHFPAVAPLAFVNEEGGDVDGAAGFTVPRLAKTKPFVLLAILAAASGSRTLQGHSLYDDEFRKILGLKFVAGGERSLELLQGLVVYTAWYPFHLRPRNKQAFQYVRMVVDIVNDLELDQDPDGEDNNNLPSQKCSDARLEQVRTYLATYYLVSSFAAAWNRVPALFYTKYTAKCCDLLERDSSVRGDHILAWHIRVQHILEQVSQLRKTKISGQNEYQISLMLKGMESQLGEWEGRMPPEVSGTRMSSLFLPAFPIFFYIYTPS